MPEPAKRNEIKTIDGPAEYLNISKSTLYMPATDNKPPGQKTGRRRRFHKEAVDARPSPRRAMQQIVDYVNRLGHRPGA